MGLDQYLICNSKKVCQETNDGHDEDWRISNGHAIYWRKASAIHKWFVDNIQAGNDDCGIYEVSIEDLARLHDTCKEVLESTKLIDADIQNGTINGEPNIIPGQKLEDSTVAEELLPTQSGLFFGSQAYDQWYWWDLEYTVELIDKLMENLIPCGSHNWYICHKDEPDWYVKFYYTSSW